MNAIVQTQRHLPGASGQGAQQGHSLAKLRQLIYFLLTMVPSATLMAAWMQVRDIAPWSSIPVEGAITMAVALWFAELTIVPLLVKCAHLMFGAPDPRTAHHEVEFFEAFAPPVLMMTPLVLTVSGLVVYAVAAAFGSVGMMLFIGRYAHSDSESLAAPGLSWLVIELSFFGWAAVSLLMALV